MEISQHPLAIVRLSVMLEQVFSGGEKGMKGLETKQS